MSENILYEYLGNEASNFNDNANRFLSFSKVKGKISDSQISNMILARYPKGIRELHESGAIHIHNLSLGSGPYCHGGDLLMLLAEGLWTVTVRAGPAKHFSSALNQCANYIFSIQQEFAGAVALGDFNTLLAPLVWKDGLNYREVKQFIQEFVFDLNFPGRSASETPFSNIMLNSECPAMLADQEVVSPGIEGYKYSDFHDESMLILKAINEVYAAGDYEGKPFTFPIPTIAILDGMKEDFEVWSDIARVEAKYGLYYFQNYYGSGIPANSVKAMCCRLNLDLNELPPAGGRWSIQGGTGSLGVVTINLPRIGFISNGDVYSTLEDVLEKVKEALILKTRWVDESLKRGLLPMCSFYGIDFNRYFRTVGVIGIPEFVENYTGGTIWENYGLVEDVLKFIRDWTKATQKETGMLWNFEMVPGESTASEFAEKDRKLFPGIRTRGTSVAPYYTALLTPSDEWYSLVDRIKFEEGLLKYFTGGTVFRIFLGEAYSSPESIWKLIYRIAKNTKIPYYDMARTFSICNSCKTFSHGRESKCRKCGGEATVYARIVGYYRPMKNANPGKLQEISDRALVNDENTYTLS